MHKRYTHTHTQLCVLVCGKRRACKAHDTKEICRNFGAKMQVDKPVASAGELHSCPAICAPFCCKYVCVCVCVGACQTVSQLARLRYTSIESDTHTHKLLALNSKNLA